MDGTVAAEPTLPIVWTQTRSIGDKSGVFGAVMTHSSAPNSLVVQYFSAVGADGVPINDGRSGGLQNCVQQQGPPAPGRKCAFEPTKKLTTFTIENDAFDYMVLSAYWTANGDQRWISWALR